MSKYTTEVRYICENASGLDESKGYNDVEEIIRNALPKIFNFNFPIFDEAYRSVLETKILKHYYLREIAHETVGLWRLRLNTKLNEIMPYYNKLYKSELLEFNPLYTTNITRDHKTQVDTNGKENENIDDTINNTRTTDNDINNTTGNTNWDVYSDTPQGSLQNVANETYLTNARKVTDSGTGHSTNHEVSSDVGSNSRERGTTNEAHSTEDYLEHVYGFEGKDGSELILKYRDTFLNIDMKIINELEELFFGLW